MKLVKEMVFNTKSTRVMAHLYSSHPLNRHITTMTYETRLEPEIDETYVTPSMLSVARESIALKTEIKFGFKNAFLVSLHVTSPRENSPTRKVSIKVFNNLRLHITGVHSIEMAQNVVDTIQQWLSESMNVPLRENINSRKVDVVLYKYQLPGEINMSKIRGVLNERNILSIYDPSNYAGIRAKIPIQCDKTASIMIFRKGKVIIIVPNQDDFDATLTNIKNQIEDIIVKQWHIVGMNQTEPDERKRKREMDQKSPR